MTGRASAGVAAVCATAAPLLVLAGSGLAAAAQPPGYDPVRQTLSALAKHGAIDRWIMTATLAGLGLAYVVVAAGVPDLRRRGRAVLAAGGLAVAAAALLPQPAQGDNPAHMVAGGVAWASFTLWPLAASRPGRDGWSARRPAVLVTVVLVVLMTWFTVELVTGGPYLGLAQRVTTVAQTAWPMTVAIARAHAVCGGAVVRPENVCSPDERPVLGPARRRR